MTKIGMNPPLISLVGAGPGDPDLLTVKARRLIEQANYIVFDRLVSKDILQLVPQSCHQVYVGKSTGRHTLPQDEINQLLVNMAQNGQRVVRLKGGDPGIFGRVGEEAEALAKHGISYEIVPGITTAQAAAAELGIALTHRDYAPKLTLISGHRLENKPFQLDESELVDSNQTLVIYMGVSTAQSLSDQLINAGRKPDTPVAVLERIASPAQRVILTNLADLPHAIERHNIKPPALIIVSKVITSCQRYQFEDVVSNMTERKYA